LQYRFDQIEDLNVYNKALFCFYVVFSKNKQLPARRVNTFRNFVPINKGTPRGVHTVTTKEQMHKGSPRGVHTVTTKGQGKEPNLLASSWKRLCKNKNKQLPASKGIE